MELFCSWGMRLSLEGRCELVVLGLGDDGWEECLHWRAVGRGGCLGFFGGLFCCCVAGGRVGLVQRGLRRAGGVQSVRHDCDGEVCGGKTDRVR